jgi:hypothetical protein
VTLGRESNPFGHPDWMGQRIWTCSNASLSGSDLSVKLVEP